MCEPIRIMFLIYTESKTKQMNLSSHLFIRIPQLFIKYSAFHLSIRPISVYGYSIRGCANCGLLMYLSFFLWAKTFVLSSFFGFSISLFSLSKRTALALLQASRSIPLLIFMMSKALRLHLVFLLPK